jgi:3' terminal RNA ribose 2'-O-methyltransferase Hen1
MLLTITTTYQPATDLGYLLHKHPARVQTFPLPFGEAHVFYPQASESLCSAALLLDIDPIALVRGKRWRAHSSFALQQYVNDRPYAASSFLSVAIARVYGSALAGNSKDRPELVDQPLPLTARISVLNSRNGQEIVRRLFTPLGYKVRVQPHPLDEKFPEWGAGDVFTLELAATIPLKDLLTHLYVLIPVLDDDKHYYVGEDEVAKLMKRGEGWLAEHPEREMIAKRYLRHLRDLTRSALELLREEDAIDAEEQAEANEVMVENSTGLNRQRLEGVYAVLKTSGARSVLDLGCGEGKLLRMLLPDSQFTTITGMDVSTRALAQAERRLRVARLPDRQREKLTLIQGSLLYRDRRLEGYDAAVLMEVIEHLEPARLQALERGVFGAARPATVILTTPNKEYNPLWPSLPAGAFRHPDHRFEWGRAEFHKWAERVAHTYSYTVAYQPIGPEDEIAGPPTQMAIFIQGSGASEGSRI